MWTRPTIEHFSTLKQSILNEPWPTGQDNSSGPCSHMASFFAWQSFSWHLQIARWILFSNSGFWKYYWAHLIISMTKSCRWVMQCHLRARRPRAGQHTLNGSPVEGGEDGWRETCSFQPAEKVLAVLCLLGDWHGVGGPGEVLCDVHPQEFSAADSLHSRAVDGQWGVVNRFPPEVHHKHHCPSLRDRLLAPHHSASCATSSL